MNGSRDEEILKELQRISKLLVLTATKDQSQKERIIVLSSIGLTPKDIADLLGTTPNTVSVTLSTTRSRSKSRKKSDAA